ncbi:YCF48-related protein [Crocosphaera sp. UHCC 0190]|uniref:WD40/YVTN/BNR-like repeat-containing protein n=1 Tax=Crocosphaera sp. UHCC 0190 TaxID=3110246 RepID=UPI002B21007D|nr:YCF48-related protein [Crocosphaera sp. UHCC 0190]MEA5510295.1 YCF48-related protein [Crocosphaera sp. UHCC 0190]
MLHFNRFLRRFFLFFIVVSFSIYGSLIHIPSVFAHRPHDVVDQLELSPNYDKNQTLFIIVRGNLFKSQDGGNSWERLWKGLDNFDNLVALSISSQNDNVLFTSSLYGGIYKSQDGGQSWEKVNNGFDLAKTKIDLLAISPYSDQVVLAADSNQAVYKTDDGGKTWIPILDNKNQTKITTISFVNDQENTIFIGDNSGNLKTSKDGGKTWERFLTFENNVPITSVFVSPQFTTDKTMFIGTENQGLFKVIDGQLSLVDQAQNLSDKLIRDIAFSPNYKTDSTLFISTWNQGIFRSQDGGKTWKKHSEGLTKSYQADEKQFSAPHFNEIRISSNFAQDKTLFLAGFNGLFKSTNGGETWQESNSLSPHIVIGIAVSPNYNKDSTLAIIDYVGTAHISYDAGKTWVAMKNGLELPRFTKSLKVPVDDPRRFFDIAFSPNYAEDKTLFLGLLRDYIVKSSDQGKNWKIINLQEVPKTFVRGTFLAPSPDLSSDKIVYVATNAGTLYQSTDRGDNFSILKQLDTRITSLLVSPDFSTDKTLYFSGFNGIYQSVDQGKTWTSKTQNLPLKDLVWWGLGISPNYKEDKTLIAGSNQGVFITKDAGKTWNKLNSLPYGGNDLIPAVAISPNYKNDQTFIVTLQGKGTFKTVDDGKTFTPVGEDKIYLSRIDTVPSASVPIQFSPTYGVDKTIYGFGSAEAEIYQSTDGGNTWNTISIPPAKRTLFDDINNLQFLIYTDRTNVFKLIIAVFIAGISYLLLGYLKLIEQLRAYLLPIKVVSTAIIFLIAILLLY